MHAASSSGAAVRGRRSRRRRSRSSAPTTLIIGRRRQVPHDRRASQTARPSAPSHVAARVDGADRRPWTPLRSADGRRALRGAPAPPARPRPRARRCPSRRGGRRGLRGPRPHRPCRGRRRGSRAAGFEASGCGAAHRRRQRGRRRSSTARRCSTRRGWAPARSPRALGGLSAGKLPRRRARLRRAAPRAGRGGARPTRSARSRPPSRTLVAMSGGVDSAVAALLLRAGRARRSRRSPSSCGRDPENDGERSCCSAAAVRGARALAHRLGLPHFTLDLREEFRAGVVEPVARRPRRRGVTPNPCVRLQRPRPPRRDARPRRPARRRARWPPATTRARRRDGLLRLAADPAKDQTYMLAALAPATLAPHALPARRPDQAAGAGLRRARPACRSPRKPDSQDLCFLAGTGRAAFLARHGGLQEPPRRPRRRARARVLGRHRGHHGFTVGQRRGIGVGGDAEPLYVLATDARANTVTVGPRDGARHRRAVRVRDLRLHGAPRRRACKLRYRVAARRRAGVAGRRARSLDEPVDGAAPGQTAVFAGAGTRSSDCATDRRA